jgi:hypothetical protein
MTLDELLDNGERHAHRILIDEREQSLAPFYHFISADQSVIMPCRWQNDIQKQLTIHAAKKVAREVNATMAMFIGEAWMTSVPAPLTAWHEKRMLQNMPSPSQSPDRVEVVQLTATDGKTSRARMLQIIRDKPGGRIISLVRDKGIEGTNIAGQLIDGLIVTD